jgi:drug/metabolite transporter (DMT)-like permease
MSSAVVDAAERREERHAIHSLLPTSPYLRACVFMVLAMVAFVLNDTLVKRFTAEVPIGQLVAVRGAFTVLFILVICHWQGALKHLDQILTPKLALRASLDLVGTLAFIVALKNMPIANLTAIIQTAPLAVTAFGVFILGEKVGWRRTLSITTGFLGVLLIVRPAPASFTIYEALAIGIVVVLALHDTVTRRIPAQVRTGIIALANATFVTIGGSVLGAVQGFKALTGAEVLSLAVAAVLLGLGYFLMILTLRGADIAQTAPFRFTVVLFAVLSSIFVFGETPDRWVIGGIILIVMAGIYTLRREAKLAREADAGLNSQASPNV